MAPRKRKPTEAEEDGKQPTTRVTRSSARLAQTGATLTSAAEPAPEKKKPPPKKKARKTEEVKETEPESKPEPELAEEDKGQNGVEEKPEKGRTVVIEHCKQCNSFKTRAFQVKSGLESGVSGITVLVNPDKPRRGCFEIREEGGEKFISLLEMKRPFKPMKDLNMDEVISDIIDKLTG